MTNAGFDEKTRVLTLDGLKYFRDVDYINDQLATLHPVTHKLEYQEVQKLTISPHDGPMIKIKNDTFDLIITPEQPLLFRDNDGSIRIGRVRDENRSQLRIPQGHEGYEHRQKKKKWFTLPAVKNRLGCYPRRIPMDDWMKFLGIFLTDGSVYVNAKHSSHVVAIYQKKPKYIEEIVRLIESLPYRWQHRPEKAEWRTSNKQLATYLVQFGKGNKRLVPQEVFKGTREQKHLFIKWMWMGDGTHGVKGTMKTLGVASPQMRDSVLNLLIQLGHTFSVATIDCIGKKMTINGKITAATCLFYYIHLKKGKNYYVRRRSIEEVHYKGSVFNLVVSNGLVLIERNGRFTWCPAQPQK